MQKYDFYKSPSGTQYENVLVDLKTSRTFVGSQLLDCIGDATETKQSPKL